MAVLSLTIWVLVGAGVSFHSPMITKPEVTMNASWYGIEFQGHRMANGEKFDKAKLTVAHRDLPLGTTVLLTNPETGKKVQAIVKDRGPFVQGRHLDVSEKVARKLEMRPGKNGTAPLQVQVLK